MSATTSRKTYLWVYVGLGLLLMLTWGVAHFRLGPLNTIIAMLISFAKMALILLYFMHVRYTRRFVWLFVAAGFFWFSIMVFLSFTDYFTRG